MSDDQGNRPPVMRPEDWGILRRTFEDGPQSLQPSRGMRPGNVRFQWAMGAGGVPVSSPVPGPVSYTPADIVPVREVNRFPYTQTLTFSLTTAVVLAVSDPDTTRILLTIRNASASANSVLVGFGNSALSATNASFEIVAGGVILLDYVVPQDDVYLVSAGTSTCVVTYANSPL